MGSIAVDGEAMGAKSDGAAYSSLEQLSSAEQISVCHVSVGYLRLAARADTLSESAGGVPASCTAEQADSLAQTLGRSQMI